jgi:hypothetical protein
MLFENFGHPWMLVCQRVAAIHVLDVFCFTKAHISYTVVTANSIYY